MAQRIVTLCDAHQTEHDEEVPGTTWEVTLMAPGETKPRTWEVDLCEADGKPLTDLATYLSTIGRQTEGPKRKRAAAAKASSQVGGSAHAAAQVTDDEAWPCPVEGCGKRPATRKALGSHLRQYHDGMSLAQALGEPEPFKCPDCDFTSSRPQGVGAHRSHAHGYVPGEGS